MTKKNTETKHHILIVDDDLVSQMIYSNILTTKCKFDVTCANNGRDAIEKLDDQFAAILMDINMPEMDGIAATKEIRKNHDQEQLPIIGITADSSSKTKKQCILAGMNCVFTKPIHAETLQNILQQFNIY